MNKNIKIYIFVFLFMVFGCQGKEIVKNFEKSVQPGSDNKTENLDTAADQTMTNGIIEGTKTIVLKEGDGFEKGNHSSEKDIFRDENTAKEGTLIVRHKNGKPAKEMHYNKKGKLDGLASVYYENGQMRREAYYKNGKPEGIVRTYYKNGKIMEEWNYKNGLLDGASKFYDANGKLVCRMEFSNGKQLSRKNVR